MFPLFAPAQELKSFFAMETAQPRINPYNSPGCRWHPVLSVSILRTYCADVPHRFTPEAVEELQLGLTTVWSFLTVPKPVSCHRALMTLPAAQGMLAPSKDFCFAVRTWEDATAVEEQPTWPVSAFQSALDAVLGGTDSWFAHICQKLHLGHWWWYYGEETHRICEMKQKEKYFSQSK